MNLYVIVCKATQKALTIKKQSDNSSLLYQWSFDTPDENQQFHLIKTNNNLCEIVHRQTNQTLMIDSSNQWKLSETVKGIIFNLI